MKKFFSLALIAMITLLISCEKDNNGNEDNDKTVSDYLFAKSWQIELIKFTETDMLYTFRKGAPNNDVEFYSQDVITFNADGTGRYTSFGSNTFDIEWEFTDSEHSTIRYTIFDFSSGIPAPGKNLEILLENVVVTENHFKYAEIYTKDNDKSIISSVKRIAIPLQQ